MGDSIAGLSIFGGPDIKSWLRGTQARCLCERIRRHVANCPAFDGEFVEFNSVPVKVRLPRPRVS